MTQKEKLLDIVTTLEDITTLVEYFAQQDSIPQIELDIVKDKLRWVYENLPVNPLNTEKNPENPTPTQEKTSLEDTALKDKEKTAEPLEEEKSREIEFEVNDKPEQTQPVSEEPEKEPENEKEKNSEILSDKYKTGSASLNEYMGKHSTGRDFSSRLHGKPLKNIHQGIGVNDKFQFINELFKGDRALYEKTIDRLNNASDFNNAFVYLQDNFNWDRDNPLVLQLLELTRRKFITSHHE